MNILIDKLPHHVEIDGVKYQINCDFRTSIRFELLIQESDLSIQDKVNQALKLYFNEIPYNTKKAVEQIIWFYSCGASDKDKSSNDDDTSSNFTQRAYSFEYDKNYIFSAFYQIYGIDLTKKDLHWWKFKALFNSLTDDCLFSKIMYYRNVEINSKMSKEYQQHIRKLKELYALPLTKTEQKQVEEFENALANGDISQFEEGQSCNLMEV